MFERFIKPESERKVVPASEVVPDKESALEDEEIIKRVLEQAKQQDSVTSRIKSDNSGTDDIPHRVRTDEEVVKQRDKAANPHGFTELKR